MWRRATSCNVLQTIAGAKARALLWTEKGLRRSGVLFQLSLPATSWAVPRIARLRQSPSESQKGTQAESGISRGVPWLRQYAAVCPMPWGSGASCRARLLEQLGLEISSGSSCDRNKSSCTWLLRLSGPFGPPPHWAGPPRQDLFGKGLLKATAGGNAS